MSEHRLIGQTFDEYAKEDGVSATVLDWIRRSPAHCRAFLGGELDGETDALSLGTLAHLAVFQPDLLSPDLVHIQPDHLWVEKERAAKLASAIPILDDAGKAIVEDGNIKVRWNGQLSEAKNWIKSHGDKEQVSAKEFNVAMRIRDNAFRQPVIRAILSGGYAEQSLFVEDEHGTMRKSRFDYIAMSGNVIPDLKTCRSAHPDDFEKAIERYHYFERAAFYLDNAELAGMEKESFIFICIETDPPYVVAVYQLNDFVIEAGRAIYKRDLQLYRNCIESGKWPGYHDGIREIALPPFRMRQLEDVI